MIYSATVVSPGILNPIAFLVKPDYTRFDGLPAPTIEALPMNGIECLPGDVVFCAEGINDFSQSNQLIINDNGGAFPLIFGTLASPLFIKTDLRVVGNMRLLGDMTLGTGLFKMVIGDNLETWAQSVDAAIAALYAWGASVTPPFPETPIHIPWNSILNLSQKHTLD